MASPAGTASATESVADRVASQMLFQNDATKSGWAKTALNQRSEMPVARQRQGVLGRERHQADDYQRREDERHDETVKDEGEWCRSFAWRLPKHPPRPGLDHAVIGQHDEQVGDKHDDRDGGAEGPVQLVQIFVVHERRRHLQPRPPSRPGSRRRWPTGRIR